MNFGQTSATHENYSYTQCNARTGQPATDKDGNYSKKRIILHQIPSHHYHWSTHTGHYMLHSMGLCSD